MFSALIPPQYQVLARVVITLVLASVCFAGGWTVNGWRLGTQVADLKTEHAQAVADAAGKALARQKELQAQRDELAGKLAALSASQHEDMTRREREIDILRPAVAAGTRIVRVAAACPAAGGGLPEAAAGGRVDPAAGAVLAPDAGQRVLDLRAGAIRFDSKLAACQAAVKCMTGQGACTPQ